MTKFELLKPKLIELFYNGLSAKDIAKNLNVSKSSIYNWLKVLNLNSPSKLIFWSNDLSIPSISYYGIANYSNFYRDPVDLNNVYCYRTILRFKDLKYYDNYIEDKYGNKYQRMRKQTYIISAFPGTGKTYFHKNNPDISLDSDSSEFSWIIDENGDKIRNPEFPQNYINHIKENIGKYKFIFVSSHKEVRDLLNLNYLQYYLVYPSKLAINEYIERYILRGSDEKFIELIKSNWENWLTELSENTFSWNHELQIKETLTDYLEHF